MTKTKREQLEKQSYHMIEINHLLKFCHPLNAWYDIGMPITKEEVFECLENNNESLQKTPFALNENEEDRQKIKQYHIQKVAYFIKHEIEKPIDIEMNPDSLGNHLVSDGNHRLAGRWLAGNKFIKANVFGDITFAEEMGFWNPNDALKELIVMDEHEYLQIQKTNYIGFLKRLKEASKEEDSLVVTMSTLRNIDEFLIYDWKKESLFKESIEILNNVEYIDQKHHSLLPGPFKVTLSKKDLNKLFKPLNKKKLLKLKR